MAFVCGNDHEKKQAGSSKEAINLKIVMSGDGSCGKTSCLNVFTKGFFPDVYEPTIFENYVHEIYVDGKQITLSLWDTAGQEEYENIRSLSYSESNVILLCYSIDSKDSLENIENKWKDEVEVYGEKTADIVLMALKCDLRQLENKNNNMVNPSTIRNSSTNYNTKKKYITYEEGLAVAKKIGAVRYLECSAKLNKGVNEAFTEVSRVGMEQIQKHNLISNTNDHQKEKNGCTIM